MCTWKDPKAPFKVQTEWLTVPCLLRVAQTVVGLSPKPPPMLADMSAGMWMEKAQLPCWPLYSQQVLHQRWISGIHCMQVTKHASDGSTLALKPRGDVTRSPKQGYQWPHEKDLCPPKIKKKSADRLSVVLSSCTCHQLLLSGETQYQSKPELLPG